MRTSEAQWLKLLVAPTKRLTYRQLEAYVKSAGTMAPLLRPKPVKLIKSK